jgi:hypothetical protein
MNKPDGTCPSCGDLTGIRCGKNLYCSKQECRRTYFREYTRRYGGWKPRIVNCKNCGAPKQQSNGEYCNKTICQNVRRRLKYVKTGRPSGRRLGSKLVRKQTNALALTDRDIFRPMVISPVACDGNCLFTVHCRRRVCMGLFTARFLVAIQYILGTDRPNRLDTDGILLHREEIERLQATLARAHTDVWGSEYIIK